MEPELDEGRTEAVVDALGAAQVTALVEELQQAVSCAPTDPGLQADGLEIGRPPRHGTQYIKTSGQGLCPRRRYRVSIHRSSVPSSLLSPFESVVHDLIDSRGYPYISDVVWIIGMRLAALSLDS